MSLKHRIENIERTIEEIKARPRRLCIIEAASVPDVEAALRQARERRMNILLIEDAP